MRSTAPAPSTRGRRRPHRTILAACLPLSLALAAMPGVAQDNPSGSTEHTAIHAGTVSLAGSTASAGYSLEASLGEVATGWEGSSAGYRALGGVLASEFPIGATPPLVFGVTPGTGGKSGGEPITVVGFQLNPPGATTPTIFMGSSLATNVVVHSNNEVGADTPPGENVFGNPLAETSLWLVNNLGSDILEQAYVYLPALLQNSPAKVGANVELELVLGGPATHFVAFGLSSGFGPPLAGIEGALELLPAPLGLLLCLTGTTFSAGQACSVPIPNDPSYVGVTLGLQGLVVPLGTSPPTFTNLLELTFI